MKDNLQVLGDRKEKGIDRLVEKAGKDRTIKRVLEGEQRVPKKQEDENWICYFCDRLDDRGVDANDWEDLSRSGDAPIKQVEGDWLFKVIFELEPSRYYPNVKTAFYYSCGEEGWCCAFSEPPEYKVRDNWCEFKVTDPAGGCEVHMYEGDIIIHEIHGALEKILGKYYDGLSEPVSEEYSMEEILCDIADFIADRVEYYEKHGQVEIPKNER